MNKIQLHLFAFIFAAFLPPKSSSSDEEENYYTILGLERSCKQEEIRKAYKKKSLQYHPDKVAQFAARNKNKSPEEIQADFVKIKEAYDILSDVKKRNAYDVLGPEGAKMFHAYQDPEGGGNAYADPNMLAMNLATASFFNKSKLFFLVLLAIAIVLLGPILICVKIDSIYNENGWLFDTPWVYILIPIWVFNGIAILLALISQAWFMTLKMVCVMCLEVFLALKWDGSITWNYVYVLIPLFMHQAISIIDNYFTIRKIRHNVARMVTISYLEEKILPTFRMDDVDQPDAPSDENVPKRYYHDLSEEEKEFINELYIIVGNNDDDEGVDPFQDEEKGDENDAANKIDPEIKVLFDIADSLEFKYASYAKKDAERNMTKLIFTRIPFLVLLVLQLDLDKGWDWNLVFCTIWIEVLWDTLINCFLSFCHGDVVLSSTLRDEVVYDDLDDDSDNTGSKKNETKEDTANVATEPKVDNVEHTVKNDNEDKSLNQDDQEESEAGFAHVSFSPLISTEHENDGETTNVKMGENVSEDPYKTTGESSYKAENENNIGSSDDDDDDDDEEQYVSTEPDVMQRRTQAFGRCCNNIFLIIFMSLFLVKLNASEDESDNSGNFSAFWLILPVLLLAGLILCCCGFCIYSGVNQEQLDNIMRKSGVRPKNDKPEEKQGMDPPEVVEDGGKSTPSLKGTGFDDLD